MTRSMFALLLLTLIAAGALAAPAIADDAPGAKVVAITYAGTGTYKLDRYERDDGAECPNLGSHSVGTLSWKATFQEDIPSGPLEAETILGKLGAGGIGSFSDQLRFDGGGAGCNVPIPACTTAITPQIVPDGAKLVASSDGTALKLVMSPLQKAGPPAGFACGVATIDLDRVFQSNLPSAFETTVTVPISALGAPVSRDVAPVLAPPVPFDCAGKSGDSNEASCAQSLTWSGTVTVAPAGGCPTAAVCVTKEQKAEARKAARDYHAAGKKDKATYDEFGCGPGAGPTGGNGDEAKFICAGASAKRIYDSFMEQKEQLIEADPPDPLFARLPSTRPRDLGVVRGKSGFYKSPYLVELLASFQRAMGDIGAIPTAINRASGAVKAGDAGALAKQNHAAISASRSLAAELGRQSGLLNRALKDYGKRGDHLASKLLKAWLPGFATTTSGAATLAFDFAAQGN